MIIGLYYHPDAYTTSAPKLMGRNAAGESFLKGLLKHGRFERMVVQISNQAEQDLFYSVSDAFRPRKDFEFIYAAQIARFASVDVLYLPGPGIGPNAYQRASVQQLYQCSGWSLCGVTHTTSSAWAMDAITGLITAPATDYDAVICTSQAVKTNVMRLLALQAEDLKHRLGAVKTDLPEMPVIPLGVHSDAFAPSADRRLASRAELGIGASDIVVLYVGRLSFHAKAHPLAMYLALNKAQKRAGLSGRVVLIECGWFANQHIENAYVSASSLACPDVRVIRLDGRVAQNRTLAWSSADIFTSFSDNIQETFGITPIEALSAGLPSVVSDWDGYRDTIRDAQDGFRIATACPPAGLGADYALRHALEIDTYDMYCGYTSSLVSVDVEKAADAFVQLFMSPALRASMSQSALARAKTFDWSTVIGQYEELWEEITARRNRKAREKPSPAQSPVPWPARSDPFDLFAHYATEILADDTVVGLASPGDETHPITLAQLRQLAMVGYTQKFNPPEELCEAILEVLAKGPAKLGALVDRLDRPRPAVVKAVAWMLKLGVLTAT